MCSMNLCKVCASRFCIDLDAAQLGRKASENPRERESYKRSVEKWWAVCPCTCVFKTLNVSSKICFHHCPLIVFQCFPLFNLVSPNAFKVSDQEASISPKQSLILNMTSKIKVCLWFNPVP